MGFDVCNLLSNGLEKNDKKIKVQVGSGGRGREKEGRREKGGGRRERGKN